MYMIMEIIPELFAKRNLKQLKIKNNKDKEKNKAKIRRKVKPSESDRLFLEEILKKKIETTFKMSYDNDPISRNSGQNIRSQKTLNSLKITKKKINASYSNILQDIPDLKSEIEATKKKRKGSKHLNHLNTSKYGTVMNLLHLSNGININSNFEGFFTYFIGPGNNDLLIRKIMKKKKGWVKIPMPHQANFI